MQTTHAESAFISHLVAAYPNGVFGATLQKSGMPEFEVSARETRHAIRELLTRGYVTRRGPLFNLTDAGQEALADVIAQVSQLAA